MLDINPNLLSYLPKSYAHVDNGNVKLNCSLGVNLEPLPDSVSNILQTFDPKEMQPYPHDNSIFNSIINRLSNYGNIPSENIILGCGSMDLLFNINSMFLSQGKIVVGYSPQFSSYVDDVYYRGAKYYSFQLNPKLNFKLDIDEFIEYINGISKQISIIYIDNPNNPTGQVFTLQDIEKLAIVSKNRNAVLIIDEAYGDFMLPENSSIPLVLKYENVIVTKTMSKGLGLAGMRLGYMIAPAQINKLMQKILFPFNCSSVSKSVCQKRIDTFSQQELLELTKSKNERLYSTLENGPIKIAYTSIYSPISLLYVENTKINLHHELQKIGLGTVSGSSFYNLNYNAVRLMLPAEENMDLLIELIAKANNHLEKYYFK